MVDLRMKYMTLMKRLLLNGFGFSYNVLLSS